MNQVQNRSNLPSPIAANQFDFILLDGSGSMQDKWWEMLDAIDTYVATLKTQQLNTHINLTVFDSGDLNLVQRDTPIDTWVPMRDDPIGANWGGTPLYDAIVAMGLRLREISPTKCSVLIVTDGQETSSKVTVEQARSVIDWMRAQGWAVTFLGCDWNNSQQAKLLGADDSSSIGVAKALLSDATKRFAEKRAAYGHGADDIAFTDAEKQQFGGYLTAQ